MASLGAHSKSLRFLSCLFLWKTEMKNFFPLFEWKVTKNRDQQKCFISIESAARLSLKAHFPLPSNYNYKSFLLKIWESNKERKLKIRKENFYSFERARSEQIAQYLEGISFLHSIQQHFHYDLREVRLMLPAAEQIEFPIECHSILLPLRHLISQLIATNGEL